MIEGLPGYISATFIFTTFLVVGFFLYAIRQTVFHTLPAKIITFLLAFWLIFQTILAFSGFYLKTDTMPPRLIIAGVFPAFLLIILYFIFARESFIEKLPLRILTLLHVIRIPVEIVLWWLFQQKMIPQLMTFEGRNFDIIAGLTAPFIAWLAFKNGKINRFPLAVWNLFALGLLLNIVSNAVLSIPSSFQQFAFDQPNRAVLYFPFIWLPTIIVPIVLFTHLASLWNLLKNSPR
ncbi:MAG: hypothetical protein H0X15_11835 [Acidobacteria bacterium]|nr:hypothetical protein [Acidobacteriota bacterium]